MCGISGIISFENTPDKKLEEKIHIMNAITKHRGPDTSEVKVSEAVALGVNRLAIVGVSDNTAIYTTSTNFADIIYTGEIVNSRTIADKFSLEVNGKTCDGAVIAPLYEKMGSVFVEELAGMFAIAMYDRELGELHLMRDTSGIKPLYYSVSGDSVYFASEIKAIQAVIGEPVAISFSALSNIMRYRFNAGVTTIFPSIKRVLPSQYIKISQGKICKHFFSEKTFDQTSPRLLGARYGNKNDNISICDFRNILRDVILENTRADVNGGVFVSGGLDSSAIASIAKQYDTPYKTLISINFEPQSVNDEVYGRHLEEHLETPFEWVTIRPEDARKNLEELVFYLDEPLENPTHVGTYMMAKRANDLGLKTVLTGDGADEYFLGYERFGSLFGRGQDISFSKYTQQLWSLDSSIFQDLFTPKGHGLLESQGNGSRKSIQRFHSIHEILRLEQTERLPEYHCMRLDRMTMAWGVEARVPFLDRRVTEFSNKIDPSIRYGQGGKDWLKEVVAPFLPKSIVERKKDFFPSLPGHWIREGGVDWASEILLAENNEICEFLNQAALERWIKQHQNGTQDYGRILWACLVLELWLRAQKSRFQTFISNENYLQI